MTHLVDSECMFLVVSMKNCSNSIVNVTMLVPEFKTKVDYKVRQIS